MSNKNINSPQSSLMNQMNYSPSTYEMQSETFQAKHTPQGGNEALLKQQEERIKSLQNAVKAYKVSSETQNQKISSHDTLYIEHNALNKKYIDLERDYFQLKGDHTRLTEAFQSKNKIISEFQHLTEVSSDKFRLFEKTNADLTHKLQLSENKIEALTNMNNTQVTQIHDLECKCNEMKKEQSRKEESFNIKLNSIEKQRNIDLQNHQDEVMQFTIENSQLKSDLDRLKNEYEEMSNTFYNKENGYQRDLEANHITIEDLKETIGKYQREVNDNQMSSKGTIDALNYDLYQCQNDLKEQGDELAEKKGIIQKLNECIMEYNAIIKDTEIELKQRDNTITLLTEERDKLVKEINDMKYDIAEYQTKTKGSFDSLNMKIEYNEERMIQLCKERDEVINENKDLMNQLEQSHAEKNKLFDSVNGLERQLKELKKITSVKETDFGNQLGHYRNVIAEKDANESTMRGKYEKKINMLKLSNSEYETRVKNLISSLIALKEYANDVERSIQCRRNESWNQMNQSEVMAKNNEDAYNMKLIGSLKDMIGKIDTKVIGYKDNTVDN